MHVLSAGSIADSRFQFNGFQSQEVHGGSDKFPTFGAKGTRRETLFFMIPEKGGWGRFQGQRMPIQDLQKEFRTTNLSSQHMGRSGDYATSEKLF